MTVQVTGGRMFIYHWARWGDADFFLTNIYNLHDFIKKKLQRQ